MPPSNKNPFEKYAGALPAFSSQEEIDESISSLRDEELARISHNQGVDLGELI
jgi:hypothetical protein